jgi:hypothetical protein
MSRFLERERERERKSKRKRGCGAGGCGEICQNNGNCNVVKFAKTMETAINCRGECFPNVLNPHKGLVNLLKRLLNLKCPEISL